MSPGLLAAAPASPLWYLTRGAGLVALVLLTLSMVLGVLQVSGWSSPGWPRFLTYGLHRNVSLLVVLVLAVHIVTAEADTFAPVGWLAVAVPFASAYRPIWLGLGTLAFDLLVALVVTSLLRDRIGYRAWRLVHWAAYLSWPVAVVHGLGTGTDPRVNWVLGVTVACVVAVAAAAGWRLAHARPGWPGRRATTAVLSAAALGLGAVWTATGPLRPGWARRAGTPQTLLASAPAPASRSASGSSGSGSPAASGAGSPAGSRGGAPAGSGGSPGASRGGLPALPFSAGLSGHMSQTGPGGAGQVTVRIVTRVTGSWAGDFAVTLVGQAADGGVSMQSSAVSLGPAGAPGEYSGQVVALSGQRLVATVSARGSSVASPRVLRLAATLDIDPGSGSVQGTLTVGRNGGGDGR